MCILFSYASKRICSGEFKLIILSNRDEFFNRASKPAEFITENNIYGTDLTPGKEGGTWFGLSKLGKMCALLNLNAKDYGACDSNKAGRGFLVPNYLNASLVSSQYVSSVENEAKNCNPFNLLFFEKNNCLWDVSIFDNYSFNFKKNENEYVSISNHVYEKPFVKTTLGEDCFKKIVNQYNNTKKKQELIDELFTLATHDAGKEIDKTMEIDEMSIRETFKEKIFIEVPNYGTRTHTIVLVDDQDNITYHERNLRYPIDLSKKEWEDNVFEFKEHKN